MAELTCLNNMPRNIFKLVVFDLHEGLKISLLSFVKWTLTSRPLFYALDNFNSQGPTLAFSLS